MYEADLVVGIKALKQERSHKAMSLNLFIQNLEKRK